MIRKESMNKKEIKLRILITIVTILAITICVIISKVYGINTPLISIIGGYLSIPAILLVTWKLPYSFFVWVMCFDIFAPGLGTIVNLYRTIDSYDRIIHFLSGILLAEAGRMIMEHILEKKQSTDFTSVILLFAVNFSCMAAGLWEIYEFTGDQLLGTTMQGNNLNTMGDIVSGFLGAVVYVGIYASFKYYKKHKIQHF
ncbi:MAG: DUF2238 domain-containing protein [Anaerovorax sp.]